MTKYISLEPKEIKKTILTAYLCGSRGWTSGCLGSEYFSKVVYLGKCNDDGDMFACYYQDTIHVCKGIKGDEF